MIYKIIISFIKKIINNKVLLIQINYKIKIIFKMISIINKLFNKKFKKNQFQNKISKI